MRAAAKRRILTLRVKTGMSVMTENGGYLMATHNSQHEHSYEDGRQQGRSADQERSRHSESRYAGQQSYTDRSAGAERGRNQDYSGRDYEQGQPGWMQGRDDDYGQRGYGSGGHGSGQGRYGFEQDRSGWGGYQGGNERGGYQGQYGGSQQGQYRGGGSQGGYGQGQGQYGTSWGYGRQNDDYQRGSWGQAGSGGGAMRTDEWQQSGQSHRGRGPRNYQRSDERISEDVCDRLSDEHNLDASEIDVSVSDGEVTLSGEVESKQAKRLAEDCADSCSGVQHVQNNLRVKKAQTGESGM